MDGVKPAITLDKGLKAATIFGCAFRGDKAVQDNSGAQVQLGQNITV
jgi:hypothetical protein